MKPEKVYEADTSWFHVWTQLIKSGEIVRMGHSAFCVFMVIRSYVNFQTGASFPSVETIGELTGLRERQVFRQLQVLERMGYITKRKEGRRNTYTLVDKMTFQGKAGRPQAIASFDYVPTLVSQIREELKSFMLTGDDQAPTIIHVDKLVVNVAMRDQNNQNIVVGTIDDIEDQVLKGHLLHLKESMEAKRKERDRHDSDGG